MSREFSPESLAGMITVVFEKALIVSKTLKEPGTTAARLTRCRNDLELLFERRA